MDYVIFRIRKKILYIAALVVLLPAYLAGGIFAAKTAGKALRSAYNNKDLAADVLIAEIAHIKSGKPVPLNNELPYTHDQTEQAWGVEENSQWLLDYTNRIVPQLVMEKISVGYGIYPAGVFFFPYPGEESFNISGSMSPFYNVVFLNERHAIDPRWNDQRETLATLVHELIHAQGGNFIAGPSEDLEAYTSAATVEALAGMCNFGDQLACGAFWNNLEFAARNDLRAQLNKFDRDDVYLFIAGLLWEDKAGERYMAKRARYWAENKSEYAGLLAKYYEKPWRTMVIPGVLDKNYRLNTGVAEPYVFLVTSGDARRVIIGMPYDDTAILLGWVKYLARLVVMK